LSFCCGVVVSLVSSLWPRSCDFNLLRLQ
jgi:hypothetical protein